MGALKFSLVNLFVPAYIMTEIMGIQNSRPPKPAGTILSGRKTANFGTFQVFFSGNSLMYNHIFALDKSIENALTRSDAIGFGQKKNMQHAFSMVTSIALSSGFYRYFGHINES